MGRVRGGLACQHGGGFRGRSCGPVIGLREDLGAEGPLSPESPVVRLTDATFAPGGWLEGALNLEHRPEQEQMAQAVARSFAGNSPLLFEAGTGVGKSLAYLVPGLVHAISAKRKFLVSTATISLQEQILRKDLDLCRKLFGAVPELEAYQAFRTALLVGRGNYLCTSRLAQALSTQTELFPTEQQAELERIAQWAATTETGMLEELQPRPSHEVWEWVNADSTACSRKHCDPTECFYQKARARLLQAHIVIVNHSLLFSLLNAGMGPGDKARGILYPDDFAVIDEAHRVPDIATDHFGEALSSYALDQALKMLYNPRRKKGLLRKHGTDMDRGFVGAALDAAEVFFADIRRRFLERKDTVRLHEPDWAEALLQQPLARIAERLGTIAQDVTDPKVQDTLRDQRARLQAYQASLKSCLGLEEKDHVYWIERSGRKGTGVTLRSAPLDVAPYLRQTLFTRDTGAVLTSATLAMGSELDTFRSRIGAEAAEGEVVASPFDFERHMHVRIAADAPAPGAGTAALDLEFLADSIWFCVNRVAGGSLVLFTSYADLHKVAATLEPKFAEAGRPVFVQGLGQTRTDLTKSFAAAGNGVLFGTESFWTGVDVPGAALSQVIITRLPFDNPSDPVHEARSEWVRLRGGSPFIEITLPEALVKFRQGIGRLIRKRDDNGVITILDSRILHKEYGRRFLAVIPKRAYTVFRKSDRDSTFQAFPQDSTPRRGPTRPDRPTR